MAAQKRRSTPGVYVTETDISNVVTPAGTSIGGVVVRSKKGPINRPVLVTNDKQYIDTFGEPVFTSGTSVSDTLTPEMGYGQYAALEFLQESNRLYVVRDYDTGDKYSTVTYDTSGGTVTSGIAADSDANNPDKINEIYTLDQVGVTGQSLLIGAVGPGLDGNNVAVTIETAHSAADWINSYDAYTSSTDLSAHPIAQYVFKINVFTKTDTENWDDITYSSISASPIETWYGTRTSILDGNKNQLQIDSVINGNSEYIYVVPGTVNFDTTLGVTPSAVQQLAGGALNYGTNLTSTDGLSYFTNREDINVSIIITPTYDMTVKKAAAVIAANRKDCIVVVQSGQRANITTAAILTAETYGYSNPSYVALYAGWDKYYDQYNDKDVYIPKCIYGASLMARNDNRANVWDAPAFTNRGVLTSNGQLKQFNSDDVGILYDANINTSKNTRGYGDVMWGQKTAQKKASALDRINVRRLLLFIESSVENALLPFLGEPNDDETRLRVFNIIDDFLGGIDAEGAFDNSKGVGYQVVCNTDNNTAQVIDNNKLAVDIYVKPTKTIEFIELQTVITRTGISFSEVI